MILKAPPWTPGSVDFPPVLLRIAERCDTGCYPPGLAIRLRKCSHEHMKTARWFTVGIDLELENYWKLKKGVAWSGRVCHTYDMANQGAADKVHLTMRIPIALRKRLQRLAKKRDETLTDVVLTVLQKAVKDIELSPADFREIAAEVALNTEKIQGMKKPAVKAAKTTKAVSTTKAAKPAAATRTTTKAAAKGGKKA